MLMFFHAAIDKLVVFREFQNEMSQSPLLPPKLIPTLAVVVPFSEIVIGWLVIFKTTRKIGFLLSFCTMLVFTFYLGILTTFVDNPPCACGGILEDTSYTVHIIFNIVFTMIALFGFYKCDVKKIVT